MILRISFFSLLTLSSQAIFAEPAQVKGKVSGFPNLGVDDIVHGAVVFPSLTPQDLLQFQLEDLLAPNESMSAGPQTLEVPGNLFIPSQRERYSLFTITLSKPGFTARVQKGQPTELFSLQFKAPFSRLVSLAQKKAPYTELLPLVSTQSFGLGAQVQYANAITTGVEIPLSSKLDLGKNIRWNRPMPTPAKSFDLLVGFQKTKNMKWVPLSFLGKVATDTRLNFASSLETDFLLMAARIQNNEKNKPIQFQATLVRDQGTTSESTILVNGIPTLPSTLGLDKNTSRLSWENNFERKGWVAIVRNRSEKNFRPQGEFRILSPLSGLLSDIGDLSSHWLESSRETEFQTWAPSQKGEWNFSPPLMSGETVVFLSVDTSVDTLDPTVDTQVEPEIFSKAQGIVMKIFEVL